MADVFISYASADRALTEQLDALLTGAGYSVWWDTQLVSGERFQEAIQRELAAAGVVLVVWTPASVRSDWVYSEARRGSGRGALVQVRDRSVDIDDLPAPFDAFHCPFIDESDTLLRSVSKLIGTDDAPAPSSPEPPARSSAPDLPIARTALVGRTRDLAELAAALADQHTRVTTLTGPGGIGKTRLALEAAGSVAASFQNAVHFVPLENAASADDMWSAIADSLQLQGETRSESGVLAAVARRRMLLVLDNLEQVADADRAVDQLLRRCPALVVLATSRAPLHLAGERVYALQPLDDTTEAVELFERQAQLVRRDFAVVDSNRADVLAICHALDGLPLAIELAAARVRLLSPRALAQRLDATLDVASSDRTVSDRQRTLRRTIEWSYELLAPEHQTALAILAAFPGGARLDAFEWVAQSVAPSVEAYEAVEALTETALAVVTDDPDGEPRIGLLNTTRAFAREQLVAAELVHPVHAASARWCHQRDLDSWTTPRTSDMIARRSPLRAEVANVRELLRWLADAGTDMAVSPDVAEAMTHLAVFYYAHAPRAAELREASDWLETVLALTAGQPSVPRAGALMSYAAMRGDKGDLAGAQSLLEEARALLDGLPEEVRARLPAQDLSHIVTTHIATLFLHTEDLPAAEATLSAFLQRDPPRVHAAYATWLLAFVKQGGGDLDGALELVRQAERLADQVTQRTLLLEIGTHVAALERALGRPREGKLLMDDLIPRILQEQAVSPINLQDTARDYAAILTDLGAHEDAARLWGAADGLLRQLDLPLGVDDDATRADVLPTLKSSLGERWDSLYAEGEAGDFEKVLLAAVGASQGDGAT